VDFARKPLELFGGVSLRLLARGKSLLNEAAVTLQVGIETLENSVSNEEFSARRLFLFMGRVENSHRLNACGKKKCKQAPEPG
jgi:hypothetical protein